MPVYRSTRRAAKTLSRTANTHSSRLVELRARIRKLMNQNLRDLTGNRRARMRWSTKGYARHVVIRGGKILKGWPTQAGVPFGNLSDVPGGQPVMELLLALWTSGILRFEDASEDDVDLAVWNPTAVLPGTPLATPQRAPVETIEGAEDPEDPIEDAAWSSEVEGEASEVDEFTD
uniref:DEP domain-containing protein n=1 Tax=Ganoderma boninense TaxID=34458 RepID=A0A5K1K7V8_9APHY|nr:DEP domain-containing protein [Ganoderma boninense]